MNDLSDWDVCDEHEVSYPRFGKCVQCEVIELQARIAELESKGKAKQIVIDAILTTNGGLEEQIRKQCEHELDMAEEIMNINAVLDRTIIKLRETRHMTMADEVELDRGVKE